MPGATMQDDDQKRRRESSSGLEPVSSTPGSDSSVGEQETLVEQCRRNEILKEHIQEQAKEKKLTQELQIVAKAFKTKKNLLEKRKEELKKKKEALKLTRVKKSRQLLYRIGEISKGTIDMVDQRRELFFQNVDWNSFEKIKQDGNAVILEEKGIAKEEAELKKWKEAMEQKEKEKEELIEKMEALLEEYTLYCRGKAILEKESLKMMEPSAKRFKTSEENEPNSSKKSLPSYVKVPLAPSNQKIGQTATKRTKEAEVSGKENTSVAGPKLHEVPLAPTSSAVVGDLASLSILEGNGGPVSSTVRVASKEIQSFNNQ